ncbi:MAG: S8 family serine peptidase, partial [Flavobacteriales bacterium]|nr:S8 family serine peptidase [Flavobacteriales bacterium]
MNNFTKLLRKHLLFIGLMLFVTASFAQNRGLIEGKIRIKINTEVLPIVSQNLKVTLNSTGIIETGISRLDLLIKEFKVVKMKRVFPYVGKHESKHIKHGLHQWYELDVDSSADLREASNKFLSSSEVVSAEPVYSKTLGDSNYIKAEIESTLEEFPTNDPGLYKQWHYNNTGEQEGFVEGNDINLFEAWETTMGSRDVIVAIVDGGIDVNHSDLKDNIWVNEIELNGTKGVDDDNNGYIDDINGFNFQAYKGEITPHFHGTHVAGTVSAVNNNGIGVAGIAGGSGNGDGARLMSCQIFNEKNESGSFAA